MGQRSKMWCERDNRLTTRIGAEGGSAPFRRKLSSFRTILWRSSIAVLFLIAVIVSNAQHRHLSPDDGVQVRAYLLAGGDWSDLCADGYNPVGYAADCMACVLAKSCALPDTAITGNAVPDLSVAQTLTPHDLETFVRSYAKPPTRAPPLV